MCFFLPLARHSKCQKKNNNFFPTFLALACVLLSQTHAHTHTSIHRLELLANTRELHHLFMIFRFRFRSFSFSYYGWVKDHNMHHISAICVVSHEIFFSRWSHTYKHTRAQTHSQHKMSSNANAYIQFFFLSTETVFLYFFSAPKKQSYILLQHFLSSFQHIFIFLLLDCSDASPICSILNIDIPFILIVWLKKNCVFCFSSNFFFILFYFPCYEIVHTHKHHYFMIYRWSERWCEWLKCFVEKLAMIRNKYSMWSKWIPSNQIKWNAQRITIYTFKFMSCPQFMKKTKTVSGIDQSHVSQSQLSNVCQIKASVR